jgi:hypothetical protein
MCLPESICTCSHFYSSQWDLEPFLVAKNFTPTYNKPPARDCLAAVGDVQLGKDIGDVIPHRLATDVQPRCYLRITVPA